MITSGEFGERFAKSLDTQAGALKRTAQEQVEAKARAAEARLQAEELREKMQPIIGYQMRADAVEAAALLKSHGFKSRSELKRSDKHEEIIGKRGIFVRRDAVVGYKSIPQEPIPAWIMTVNGKSIWNGPGPYNTDRGYTTYYYGIALTEAGELVNYGRKFSTENPSDPILAWNFSPPNAGSPQYASFKLSLRASEQLVDITDLAPLPRISGTDIPLDQQPLIVGWRTRLGQLASESVLAE